MQQKYASFRDPSGYVFETNDGIFRCINECYKDDWDKIVSTQLLEEAVQKHLVIPFHEVEHALAWKALKTEKIPFISYPYEWSFSQLKQAALLTLELLVLGLKHDMILKDASAYNIQFVGTKPVFIDLLSFERWKENSPWKAYKQFCQHFLSPLALMSYVDFRFYELSKLFIDGIELDLASKLLPWRTYLCPGIFLHIHMHAKMQKKYADTRMSAKKVSDSRLSKQAILNLADSLRATILSLPAPNTKTVWGDYYQDTNYTSLATEEKKAILELWVSKIPDRNVAIDLGANTGKYSEILSRYYQTVLAVDIDPIAVEKHVTELEGNQSAILPLVLNVASPSPAIGWACQERDAFHARVQSNCVVALALIHHLFFTEGIPFDKIAFYFSSLLQEDGVLILEFVGLEDSQVQRLVAARIGEDFDRYSSENMKKGFSSCFQVIESHDIAESHRTLYMMRKAK